MSLGSAALPNLRTSYLRLRLPVIIRRMQRGETRLAVDAAKLGRFLDLAQDDIERLVPEFPPPTHGTPLRERQ